MREEWISTPSFLLLALGLFGFLAFGVLSIVGLEDSVPGIVGLLIVIGLFGGALGMSFVWAWFPHSDPREEKARLFSIPKPEDLPRIEELVEGDLPLEYCEMLLEFPVRSSRGSCRSYIWNDVHALVERNAQLHSGNRAWPRSLLFIGEDGGGGQFALESVGGDPRVHAYYGGADPGQGDAPHEIMALSDLRDLVLEHAVENGIDPAAEVLAPAESRGARLRGCIVGWLTIVAIGVGLGLLVSWAGCG